MVLAGLAVLVVAVVTNKFILLLALFSNVITTEEVIKKQPPTSVIKKSIKYIESSYKDDILFEASTMEIVIQPPMCASCFK